ncbi:hypothetical protein TNCV_2322751 [Trichonephila clavipes]|nr:hypothetical protein TNCV_2322751 [Trichonephila clavipes]
MSHPLGGKTGHYFSNISLLPQKNGTISWAALKEFCRFVGVTKGTTCTVLAGNETFGFQRPPLPLCCQRLTMAWIQAKSNCGASPDEMILKYRKIVRNGDVIDDPFAPNVKTCIACEHPDPIFRMVGHHRHILATFRDTILCMY